MTGMINLLHLDLPEKFWKAQNLPYGTVSRVSSFRHVDMPTNLWGKDSTFLLSCYFSVKSRIAASKFPTLRRPVAKGRIVFKTHKLKSFFVDTIGRDKSNAFSLSTKVHLYRMCLETSDALKFCLFFCCFFFSSYTYVRRHRVAYVLFRCLLGFKVWWM